MKNSIVKVFEGKKIAFSSLARGTDLVPHVVVKGNDLAKALGYGYSKKLYVRLDDDYRYTDKDNIVWVTEPGIYQAIFGSQLKSAKQFQRWVFEEVLPSIRTQGVYINPEHAKAFDMFLQEYDALVGYFVGEGKAKYAASAKVKRIWQKQIKDGNTTVMLDNLRKLCHGN